MMTPYIDVNIRALTDDGFHYEKVLNQNCYRLKPLIRHSEHDKTPFTVVDIGAGSGYFALCVLGLGARRVFCFEPFRENYYNLLKNTQYFGESVEQYNVGISQELSPVPIYANDAIGKVVLLGSPRFHKNTPDEQPNSYGVLLSPDTILKTILDGVVIDLLKINTGFFQPSVFNDNLLASANNVCAEVQGITVAQLKELHKKLVSCGHVDFRILNTDYEPNADQKNEAATANFIIAASKTSCADYFAIENLKNSSIESII